MEEPRMSPAPTKLGGGKMTFAEALTQLTEGKMMRRLEWEDERVFMVIAKEKLMISNPTTRKLDYLIVSVADILATDWVTFEEKPMEMA